MSLRAYLRGIGIGMLMTAVILTISSKRNTITDSEVRARAKELGMVQGNELLIGTEVSSDSASSASAKGSEGIQKNTVQKADAADKTDAAAKKDKAGAPADKAAASKQASGNAASSSGQASSEKPKVTFSNEKSEAVADVAEAVNTSTAAAEPRSTTSSEKTVSEVFRDPVEDIKAVAGNSSGQDNGTASSGTSDTNGEDRDAAADEAATEEPAKPAASSSGGGETYTVHISKGESSYAVAKALEDAGIVKSAVDFDKYLVSQGIDRRISAGDHIVPSSGSYADIGAALAQ